MACQGQTQVCSNLCPQGIVTELSERQSRSLTNGVLNNLELSDMNTISAVTEAKESFMVSLNIKEKVSTNESLSKRYCNGIMGVPITYLDKHCSNQFRLQGISIANSPLMTKHYSDYIGYKQSGIPTGRTGSTFGACPVLVKDDHKNVYYEKDGIRVQATYCRLFIQKII